jgi:hypothetical protein
MALDSAAKRWAVMGVGRPTMRVVRPDASAGEAWRASVAHVYPVASFSAPAAGTPSSRRDNMLQALRDAGYTGTIEDMLTQWLDAQSATGTLDDQWLQYLEAQGITDGALADRLLYYYINNLGADSGSALYDAEFWAWTYNPPA